MEWSLRACVPEDEAFLRRVYAASREDEIALTGWTVQQAEAFLRMQFDAQHRHFHAHNPAAAFDVIEFDGEPVGRLYVRREPGRIHIIDIAILPPWRGRGLGTALFESLQAEGGRSGALVSIHTEINNRAQELYRRLGFREISTSGLYRLMQWQPAAA